MRVFLFVFCLAIAAMGCKKDSQAAKVSTLNSALIARWELRIQQGGWQPDKEFDEGNGNMVQFNADGTYAFYENNKVTKRGTFHIISQGTGKLDLIYYDNDTYGNGFLVENDQLTIGSSAADGLSYIYAKK